MGEERTAVAKSKKGINFRQYSRELPVAVTLVALVDDRRAAGGRGTRCYGTPGVGHRHRVYAANPAGKINVVIWKFAKTKSIKSAQICCRTVTSHHSQGHTGKARGGGLT